MPFLDKLTADDAAMLLIDHQTGTMLGVQDIRLDQFRSNVRALAKTAKAHRLPTVLTGSHVEGPNGPIMPELLAMFPEAPVVHRPGPIDAFDDPAFARTVEATGRKKLIMAGVTAEVCLYLPVVSALKRGHEVWAVYDASGCWDAVSQLTTCMRLTQAGAVAVNWAVVAAMLQADWRRGEQARETLGIFGEHLPFYGMLANLRHARQQPARGAAPGRFRTVAGAAAGGLPTSDAQMPHRPWPRPFPVPIGSRRWRGTSSGAAGVGRLPAFHAADVLAEGTLVRLLPEYGDDAVEVHALYPSHRSLSAKVRVFIDAFAEHLGPGFEGRVGPAALPSSPSFTGAPGWTVARTAAAHGTADGRCAPVLSLVRAVPVAFDTQQPGREMPERLDGLCEDGAGVVGRGDPERGIERRPVEQPGGGFRVHRADGSLGDERLDRLRRRAQARRLVGPPRRVAEHGRAVQQHDAPDLRLQGHLDVGDALVEEPEPRGFRPVPHGAQPRHHLGVELLDHGLQQALLAAEVVVKRAAGQARFRGQVVHRCRRVALLSERPSGGPDELGPGLLHHLRPSPRDHRHLRGNTYKAYAG